MGAVINESKKQWMLKNGEWIATRETNKTAGFHIQSFILYGLHGLIWLKLS